MVFFLLSFSEFLNFPKFEEKKNIISLIMISFVFH
jgi:hypothetical protein